MRACSSTLAGRALIPLILMIILAGWIRIDFAASQIDGVFTRKDAGVYLNYVINLYRSGTFSMMDPGPTLVPDSFRSPGYPLLIALTMVIGGEAGFLPILMLTQSVLGTLLVPLTFLLGRFFLPVGGALIAAFLVAVSPHLITITGYLLTETLFSFCLLAALYAFQRAQSSPRWTASALAGMLFGAAYLTNETALFLPFLLAAVAGVWEKRIRKAVSKEWVIHVVVLLSVFSLFPVAWAIRNRIHVPPDAKKGIDRAVISMSHGAYPDFIYKNPSNRIFPYREDPEQPEFGGSLNVFFRVLGDRVREEPMRYLKWYTIGKPYSLWSWSIIQGVGGIYIYPVRESRLHHSRAFGFVYGIMRGIHPILIIAALFCLPLVLFKHPEDLGQTGPDRLPLLPLTACLYITLMYTLFAPWPRYSIPLRPELYLCALWTIVTVVDHLRGYGQANRIGG